MVIVNIDWKWIGKRYVKKHPGKFDEREGIIVLYKDKKHFDKLCPKCKKLALKANEDGRAFEISAWFWIFSGFMTILPYQILTNQLTEVYGWLFLCFLYGWVMRKWLS